MHWVFRYIYVRFQLLQLNSILCLQLHLGGGWSVRQPCTVHSTLGMCLKKVIYVLLCYYNLFLYSITIDESLVNWQKSCVTHSLKVLTKWLLRRGPTSVCYKTRALDTNQPLCTAVITNITTGIAGSETKYSSNQYTCFKSRDNVKTAIVIWSSHSKKPTAWKWSEKLVSAFRNIHSNYNSKTCFSIFFHVRNQGSPVGSFGHLHQAN